MRVLVTGATGFVGGHLVEALVERGDVVTALVRSPGKAALLNRLGVRQVRGDLHHPAALREAAAEQQIIYHVAGAIAAQDEDAFLRANRDGTAQLVAAARETATGEPPRFVLVSSMAAGGPSRRGAPLRGDAPARPVTRYGRSKLAAEDIVRASDLPWTILRPPMVYGPRDTEVHKVFTLVRYGIAPLFGSGDQELSTIYGPDLALALIAAATSPEAEGRVYYPCHPEVVTSVEFVTRVAQAVRPGRPGVRILPLPPWMARAALRATELAARVIGRATILTTDKANEFYQPAWTGDPGPLISDTGWRPVHDLGLGLAATAAWYRAEGWL